tara:strand:+ start:347 stop:826 length:480 start_codon:yes stop_codon:yes gene_type:complete
MAQETKANIQALNNAYLNDSVANKSIKPSQVNEVITDTLDSYLNVVDGGNIIKAVTGNASEISGTDIDLSIANHFYKTLTANTTFSLSNIPNKNMTMVIAIKQGGAGSYTITFDKVGYDVNYISLDLDETVGALTELWCRYDSLDNALYINSVSGFIAL